MPPLPEGLLHGPQASVCSPTSCFIASICGWLWVTIYHFQEYFILLGLILCKTMSITAFRKHITRPFHLHCLIQLSYLPHKKNKKAILFTQCHALRRILLFQGLPKVRQLPSGSWNSRQHVSDTKFKFL